LSMVDQKKLSMNVHDGTDFFAHETSVNFSPTQFVLDFKSITPRVDPRSGPNPVVVLRHNTVLIDPLHAKKLAELLDTMVQKYEKEFDKIQVPKALAKHEKKLKRKATSKKPIVETPTYFG